MDTYRLNWERRGRGGESWRAGGKTISGMFTGEFARDFIHQCLKKQHAVDKSELYDLHALKDILAHSPWKNNARSLSERMESHISTFSFLQPPLFLINQYLK